MRNPFAIVSTAENCCTGFKEAIKLAFLRLVEYLEHQHFLGSIPGSKWPETKTLLLKLVILFLF
jgi:hypothetical protein